MALVQRKPLSPRVHFQVQGEMLSWLSDEDSNIASSASDVTTDEENLDVKPLSTSAIDNHNQQQPAKSALFKRTLDQISTTEEAVSRR